ncbi:Uncharacterised protein g8549 [Pycnogonum litorale]
MELLWFLLIIINSVSCLKYFEIISDSQTHETNDSFSSGSFVEIKKTCMENNCNAFCCETEDNCFIISDNWNGDVVEMTGSKIYSAVQTCKNDPCSSSQTCSTLPFVNAEARKYTCCPKYKCGDNCDIENFIEFKDVDLPKNYLKELKIYQDGTDISEFKMSCLNHCFGDTACASALLYRSQSSGKWICEKKITSHKYVNLIVNPTYIDKGALAYFYRTRRCERDWITCNNMVCDAEEACIDNKMCCPKFKCGKDCSIDNFEMFPYKDLVSHVIGEQIHMSENLVADCKQYCVSDPGCKSFLLFYYIKSSSWICQKKSVTHFEVKLIDYPDDKRSTNMRYFYRTGRCE